MGEKYAKQRAYTVYVYPDVEDYYQKLARRRKVTVEDLLSDVVNLVPLRWQLPELFREDDLWPPPADGWNLV